MPVKFFVVENLSIFGENMEKSLQPTFWATLYNARSENGAETNRSSHDVGGRGDNQQKLIGLRSVVRCRQSYDGISSERCRLGMQLSHSLRLKYIVCSRRLNVIS